MTNDPNASLLVVCALLQRQNTWFVARRKAGKRNAEEWEFPGGKMEPGETPTKALQRELREELGMEVQAGKEWPPVRFASDRMRLTLLPIECRLLHWEPVWNDHDAHEWLTTAELSTLSFSQPDWPIVKALISGNLP
ncbi:MAG: (deoxy)nucleoside triphosphate pyrophosphohydrolase [Salibacteraceae bacterium]